MKVASLRTVSGLIHFILPALVLIYAVYFNATLRAQDHPGSSLRQIINLNREWKYQQGDAKGAQAESYSEDAWQNIGLPHSFSMPYFAAGKDFYVGYGWYRKHFDIPPQWIADGRRISLEFEGVFQVAEIFINGKRVGEHKGGYTGFALDVTEAVKPGANVVAVRVNNLWNARLAPRAGEHVFSGGIYRNVRLVVTAPVHVAWYGTFVTTPQVSRESAKVNVKTEIVNASATPRATVTVRTSIVGPDGKLVTEIISPEQTIAANATYTFDQTSGPIANPKLWHPDHPHLYTVRTTVLEKGRPVDDFISPLGFRWFQFTADKGFFLNGEHCYFKGANVHQDQAGWGDAVPDSGAFRDVKMVKEAGFDFIRGSHYPHAPAFSRACDELGMLFWSENTFWGTGGFKGDGYWNASAYPTNPADEEEFEASLKQSLREMIRIHRNHPSIIVWSTGNEEFFCPREVMPKVRECLKRLVAYSRELDPTRPSAIGGAQRGEIDKLGDLAGYNGDGSRLFLNPGIPSVVTEYGSGSTDRPGKYDPGWGDLQSVPGMEKRDDADSAQPYAWRFPWRSGECIWCAFDHGSIAGRRFGAMGIVDYFRLPKRAWYWYRNSYRKVSPPEWPVEGNPAALKLTADRTELPRVDGTEDAHLIVTVVDREGKPLSNSPAVTLTIESGPGEFPTGPSITFDPKSDITIRDGQAAIAFRSYFAGKTRIRATSPGLTDATLDISSSGGPEFVAGKSLQVGVRPYVRFTPAVSDSSTTLGQNNPARCSSEAPDHGARLANDGNEATYWQSAEGAKDAWWQVDVERDIKVSSVKLTFPEEGNWRYRVEISDKSDTGWKLVADETYGSGKDKVRTLKAVEPAATGRCLRIVFPSLANGKRAALSEVEVKGEILSP
ncbi:MAG: glycoside hydrolase family 2 TIM barrel-domain containing protein [Candidatus Methylacidiphilales bacterium]